VIVYYIYQLLNLLRPVLPRPLFRSLRPPPQTVAAYRLPPADTYQPVPRGNIITCYSQIC
jgi:hypothetical protein